MRLDNLCLNVGTSISLVAHNSRHAFVYVHVIYPNEKNNTESNHDNKYGSKNYWTALQKTITAFAIVQSDIQSVNTV